MHPAIKHMQQKYKQEKIAHWKNQKCDKCGCLKDKPGLLQEWDNLSKQVIYVKCYHKD